MIYTPLNSEKSLHDFVSNNDSSRGAFLYSVLLLECSADSDDDCDESFVPPLSCRYYDTDSLCETLKSNPTSHTLFHLNIASLPRHADDLNALLRNLDGHQFSVIGITETKISSPIIPQSLSIPGYHYLHTPSKSCKGGAALFISNKLNFFARNDLNTICYADNELESCFAELPSLVKSDPGLIVGSIYKHPSMESKKFLKQIKSLLHKISIENKRLILLGDFNINLLNASSDSDVTKFIDILSCYSVLPTINIPTRLTSTSKTLIDNIFCNYSDPNFVSGNICNHLHF